MPDGAVDNGQRGTRQGCPPPLASTQVVDSTLYESTQFPGSEGGFDPRHPLHKEGQGHRPGLLAAWTRSRAACPPCAQATGSHAHSVRMCSTVATVASLTRRAQQSQGRGPRPRPAGLSLPNEQIDAPRTTSGRWGEVSWCRRMPRIDRRGTGPVHRVQRRLLRSRLQRRPGRLWAFPSFRQPTSSGTLVIRNPGRSVKLSDTAHRPTYGRPAGTPRLGRGRHLRASAWCKAGRPVGARSG